MGHGITEQFAQLLFLKKMLPDDELNDGLILAETALAHIPVLVTSDRHLLDIEASELKVIFDERDLFPVTVFHPKRLLRAIQ